MLAMSVFGNYVVYRTREMSLGRARSFANFLEKNPRFRDVRVNQNGKTLNACVEYLPANPERREAIQSPEQRDRVQRAEVQAGGYRFKQVSPSNPDYYYCLNQETGVLYTLRVTSGRETCSCPDQTHRGSREGHRCKHLVAAARFLVEGRR